MITIYNSLTNNIEEFKPIKEGEISMYVCGSTVYSNMHIGNSRPIVFFDVVARFFTYLGYYVRLVSNFTDIDDKIIKRAKNEGISENEVSESTIKAILATYKKLNILSHYKNPKVTENINQIITLIKTLIENGGAYIVDGDVYFDINVVDDYGILSGQEKDSLIAGARIEENDKKHHPNDFNLWKETNEGLNWDSPWSKGRPGWHSECVAMINDVFGDKIDIHGGGVDIKFPHHDNEIAQAEVAYGHHLANYWMHNGRIDMRGEKMSKSLGNVIDADQLVSELGYGVFRLMLLNVPYRQPLNYRDEIIIAAKADYEKITRTYLSILHKLQLEYNITEFEKEIVTPNLLDLNNEFINALSDDFNTANAITVIYKLHKEINSVMRNESDANTLKEHLTLLHKFMWVLGIEPVANVLSEDDLHLINSWQQARKNKDYLNADKLRQEIGKRNIYI